jgi:hypothetical protein
MHGDHDVSRRARRKDTLSAEDLGILLGSTNSSDLELLRSGCSALVANQPRFGLFGLAGRASL